MNRLYDHEVLRQRAENLKDKGLNGLKLLFVRLIPPDDSTTALLDVEFHNGNQINSLKKKDFKIFGGSRVPAENIEIKAVSHISGSNVVRIDVSSIGDYSTYRLEVTHSKIDPLFKSVCFKFRPGCFNVNCAPEWEKGDAPVEEPVIDYLAKDFNSFKHVLINSMMVRVPNWSPTSEADLDQVLIDLIAAVADELSDFQDRVMNEAYFGRTRKRVSLARHARLMDYHIHQGNQASTWIALNVDGDLDLPKDFGVWTEINWDDPGSIIFITKEKQKCFRLLNELSLYTWGKAVTALEMGSVEADIALPHNVDPTVKANADALRDTFRKKEVKHLLIEQKLDPDTGKPTGCDKTARQLLALLEGDACAESIHDTFNNKWLVRVRWKEVDRLQRRYCFITKCEGEESKDGVSSFHGNLVKVFHGRPHVTEFHPMDIVLGDLGNDDSELELKDKALYEPAKRDKQITLGALCRLPHSPLAYTNTLPGGEEKSISTLTVEVKKNPGGDEKSTEWIEQIDFIESQEDDEHFVVETDEYRNSTIRFGNNRNGRGLPPKSIVTCRYQIGGGIDGNVGADTLTGFNSKGFPNAGKILEIRNPFDVIDGRNPEDPEVIKRRAQQAFRVRQLRAVTLEDYAKRAEEVQGVSHAHARYAWTGSWRTVQLAIDPAGTSTLDGEQFRALRLEVEDHLRAVSLIGDDIEIRRAHYVPLDIKVRLCAHNDFWPEDLKNILEQEFSDAFSPDGRTGFFHPDQWTFGQSLRSSQIVGRALEIEGVERVLMVSMRRMNVGFGPTLGEPLSIKPEEFPEIVVETLEVEPFEIIQVANDPDHVEYGRIQFDILGGRQ